MTIKRVGFTINMAGDNKQYDADHMLTPTTGEKVKVISVRISPSTAEATTKIYLYHNQTDLSGGGIPMDCIDDYTHAIEMDCDVNAGETFIVKASGSVAATIKGSIEYIQQ